MTPETARLHAAARMLGLPAGTCATSPVSLERVEHWGLKGWILEVEGSCLPRCRFFIESAALCPTAYCRSEHLAFGYEADPPPPILLTLLDRFRSRLEGRTWEQVRNWLDDRPGIRRPPTQEEAVAAAAAAAEADAAAAAAAEAARIEAARLLKSGSIETDPPEPHGRWSSDTLANPAERRARLERKLSILSRIGLSWHTLKEHFCPLSMTTVSGAWIEKAWARYFSNARLGLGPKQAVLYIHLPFCQSRCSYCQANSGVMHSREELDDYLALLHREIAIMSRLARGHEFQAAYFGGGTPSLLTPAQIDTLLGAVFGGFARSADFHFTFEMNPTSVTQEQVRVLKAFGCNRVSMGVQSVAPAVLRAINRGYQTFEAVEAAVRTIRKAGIQGLNIDVMTGLPDETTASFEAGLRRICTLDTTTITVFKWLYQYSNLFREGRVDEADTTARRDEQSDLARRLIPELRPPLKVTHYVLSDNFHYDAGRDAENVYAWMKEDHAAAVLGMGRGAESRITGMAYLVGEDDWDAVAENRIPGKRAMLMDIDFEMANVLSHMLLRGGRTGGEHGGIAIEDFAQVFGRPPREYFDDEIEYLIASGIIREADGRLEPVEGVDEEAATRALMVLFTESDLSRIESSFDGTKGAG